MKPSSALVLLALSSGCGGDTVTLDLRFPSEGTFVRVDTVEVFAVPLADDQRGTCPELMMQAASGTLRGFDVDSGAQPACDLLASNGLELPASPPGAHAYIAIARAGAATLLSGCTATDLAADARTTVPITLAITSQYRTMFPAGTPAPTCSAAEKCGGCHEP